jgi:hypothetical protein
MSGIENKQVVLLYSTFARVEVKRFFDFVDRFMITVGESFSEIGKTRPQFWSGYRQK